MKAKLYESSSYVNPEAGYTLRMNYSYTENFELHHHDYYEFFLTISGKAVHVVNGKTQKLPEHSLVFVRAKDEHTYIKEGVFSFVNLTITGETMEKLCGYLGGAAEALLKEEMPPVVILGKDDFAGMMERLNELNTVEFHDKEKMFRKMKFILVQLMEYFLDHPSGKQESGIPDWLTALVSHMKRAENIGMGLTEMAQLSGRSKEHISRSFQKYYGITAAGFMNEQRVNYCANLLLNTNLPILDICYEGGFQNVSWFYRKFREKFGMTPVEFRRRLSERSDLGQDLKIF